MEGCIRDKFEETGKGALKTDGKKHGGMLWRQVGEDVKGCRRQIGGNRKGCIRDKLKETVNDALRTDWRRHGRMHWRQITGNLKGCRRQIGRNMEGCITNIWRRHKETLEGDIGKGYKETRGRKHVEGDTWRHSKETCENIERRHWMEIQWDIGRKHADTLEGDMG